MKSLLYIFLGGGIGSLMRYLLSAGTHKLWHINSWPMGTFLVNILGCFLIGLLSASFLKSDSHLKFLLVTGFCGGFTTFSTFSLENYSLYQNGNYGILVAYSILSLVVGFLAVVLGFMMLKNFGS